MAGAAPAQAGQPAAWFKQSDTGAAGLWKRRYDVDRRNALKTLGGLTFAVSAAGYSKFGVAGQPPLNVVVPFPPGGGTDVLGRVVAAELDKTLDRSVIVENKAGASGMLGADYVAKAPANGNTMLFSGLVPSIKYYNLSADALLKKLSPVCSVARSYYMVAVNAGLKVDTFQDLVALARREPKRLYFGTPGNATPQHIATELLQVQTHTEMTHVPYRGTGPMMTDLMGGQIQVVVAAVAAVEPYLNSGRLKVVAVTSPQPLADFPQFPTIAASGYPGFTAEIGYATYAPAGTGAATIATLNKGLNAALGTAAVGKSLSVQGFTTAGGSPRQLEDSLRAEMTKVSALIRQGRIKVDL